jgi:hypothetical protein
MKKTKYILSGHNSFYLRDGWLNKGYKLVENKDIIEANLFSKNNIDTVDTLGLGSMMVQSLKFWMVLLGVLKKERATRFKLSKIAEEIFKVDPYLQNRNTLWILHLNIFNLIDDKAILWECIFEKDSNYNNFTREDLDSYVGTYLREKEVTASSKTIKDCLNTFIRMYSSKVDISINPEENLFSPFSRLDYLSDNGEYYRFRNINHNELSEYIAYLIFWRKLRKNYSSDQLSLSEGYKEVNRFIKMSFFDYEKLVSKLEIKNEIKIDRAAGLENIIFDSLVKNEVDIIKKILQDESR